MRHLDWPVGRRRFLGILGGAAAASAFGSFDHILGPGEAHAQWGSVFPITGATASRVLNEARSRGANFSELYLERRIVTGLSLSDSVIDSVEQGIYAGCGVRAIDGDRVGYAFTDSFEEPALIAAARSAGSIASYTMPGLPPLAFSLENPIAKIRYRLPFDEVAQNARVVWLTRADEAARAYDPAVKQVTIEYRDEMLRFGVVNSEGVWIEDTLPLMYLRVNVNAAKEGGRRGTGLQRLSERRGAEQMENDAAGRIGKEAARMAVAMCDAIPAPAGDMPVILAAGGGVLFHEAVGHGLEGDGVRKKTSFYTGRVGEAVASNRVSIIENGGMENLRGSFNVDDEGTPPQQNILVEAGVLRGFMTDRITAQALDAGRTGNGRRQSYRFPPIVRMTNTYLYEGQDDVDQMIKDTKSGLYARNLGGGEVDTTSGNFTFGVLEGYRIEDGKITAPVRGAVLVGNGPEIMTRIDRVGPDLVFWPGTCGKGQWVPVSSGAPTLRISSMTIGGEDRA
jgi:TldD protein